MQVLHDRFKDDPNVSVLAVHLNEKGDPVGYMKEKGFTYRMVPDGREVTKALDVKAIPAFLVIGPDGTEVHRHVGQLTNEKRDEIERIARETAGS